MASAWRHAVITLSSRDASVIQEVAGTIEPAGDDPWRQITQQEATRTAFERDWPPLTALVTRVRELLAVPPHFVLLTSVPLSPPHHPFYVALTRSLGHLADPYQTVWSRIIYRIRPQNDRTVEDRGVLNEHLHTDGTDWPAPNDLTCLLCEAVDRHDGGRSRLLPIDDLQAHVESSAPDLPALMAAPVPWRIADSLGGGVTHAPILTSDRIRWLRYTLDAAIADGAALPTGLSGQLDRIEHLIDTCPTTIEMSLQAGDMLIVNNTRCMHARTPVRDVAASGRALARIKVLVRD
jgi:hypothetical protein